MKTILTAAVIAIVSGSSAFAADMAVKAPMYAKAPMAVSYNWSGFYLGAHAGEMFGRTRVVDDGVLTEAGAPTNGFIGGVLAGYNWQNGPLVLGVEGDFGWTHAVGHGAAPVNTVTTQLPNTYTVNWDSHLVGKIGYAAGQWLFFGTGGLAIADFSFQPGEITTSSSTSGGKFTGFSVGGGIDYAFTQNVFGRLQYIYDDFGSKNYIEADGGVYHVSFTSQTVRAALAWKF